MEEGSTVGEENERRGGVGAAVGYVGEFLVLIGLGDVMGMEEGRASDNIRTAMDSMDVGEDRM